MKQKLISKLRRNKGLIISTVILVASSIIMLFPFYWLLRSAFMTDRQIMTMPIIWLPTDFSLRNFVAVFNAIPFTRYILNSTILVIINLVGTLASSSFIAFGFARLKFKGQRVWFALMISTMMLPFSVVMIPQFVGWLYVGAFNTFIPLTLPAFFGSAFSVFLIMQFYMGIPKDYDEAAFIDGASYFKIYLRILAPMSKPVLCAVGVFTFMGTWNDFMGPLLYLHRQSLRTVALGLRVFVNEFSAQYNLVLAGSTMAVIPMIILFFSAQRYFIQGITFTGLKG